MHERLWFDLGWDYASHNVRTPEDAPVSLLTGHKEGKSRFNKPISEADRYVRKWLQLRYSALRRQRHFDIDVDTDFLRSIDTDICPVTQERLTHGTLCDTDWSVDRVVNDGGYCRSNLVIMSTRANTAKSTMTFDDVYNQLSLGADCNDLLQPDEWLRLLSLIYPCHFVTGTITTEMDWTMPLNPEYPDHLPRTFANHVQMSLVLLAMDRAYKGTLLHQRARRKYHTIYAELKAASGGAGLKILQKMLIKMERKAHTVANPLDLMWNPGIYTLYLAWCETDPYLEKMVRMTSQFVELTDADKNQRASAIHLESRGYMAPG